MHDHRVIEMQGVCKRFGATVALDGVDFHVKAGSIHAVIGENGAGKSTLMKILSGAIAPDHGVVRLDGHNYAPTSPSAGRMAGVAMIYQELSLAPHLSVRDNLVLGSEPTAGPFLRRRQADRIAREAIACIGHPELPLDAPARSLPSAQRQLVEIARAVASKCKVLLLDEPTSSLSSDDIERLLMLMRSLRDDGVAIVYISHALDEVRAVSDSFTVLRDGCVAGTGLMANAGSETIVHMMVGRTIDALYPHSARTPGEVLLQMDKVAGAALPVDATLQVRRGEIVGIAGLMGAGRTELLRTIHGLDPIRSGTVALNTVLAPSCPHARWDAGMGMVSEDRRHEGLAVDRTVAENLTLPALARHCTGGVLSPSRARRAARDWIERLGIRCQSPHDPVRTLSGGNQQKIAIARLLHADCDVLLLDEPTRGIDVAAKVGIYALIDQLAHGDALAGRPGAAILIISSYLPELLGMCDRIAVMRRGRLGPARPIAEVSQHSIMTEAMGIGVHV